MTARFRLAKLRFTQPTPLYPLRLIYFEHLARNVIILYSSVLSWSFSGAQRRCHFTDQRGCHGT